MNNDAMDSAELLKRLKALGVDHDISIDRLQRWAKHGVIPPYTSYYQHRSKRPRGKPPKLGGKTAKAREEKRRELEEKRPPGHYSAWPPETVEEAAAVYAVHQYSRKKGRTLKTEMVKVIKRAAAILDKQPFAVYTVPPIVGPLSAQHINPEHIKVTFVSEDFDGLDLFPGANRTEKADYLNPLVITWVAAIEKVREWKSRGIRAQIMKSELKNLTPAEIDYSQFDPWRVEVPCPWRIDRPARITLYWWSRPSEKKNKDRDRERMFWKFPFIFQRELTDYKCDDIILLENFIDVREFVKIDIGDRKRWASAEREKIERELEEKECILKRLGMKNISLNTLIEMEQTPFESLTERQQLGLKAANEKMGLQWRLAWLTTNFSVEVEEESE